MELTDKDVKELVDASKEMRDDNTIHTFDSDELTYENLLSDYKKFIAWYKREILSTKGYTKFGLFTAYPFIVTLTSISPVLILPMLWFGIALLASRISEFLTKLCFKEEK